jgi:hypothetical protein
MNADEGGWRAGRQRARAAWWRRLPGQNNSANSKACTSRIAEIIASAGSSKASGTMSSGRR